MLGQRHALLSKRQIMAYLRRADHYKGVEQLVLKSRNATKDTMQQAVKALGSKDPERQEQTRLFLSAAIAIHQRQKKPETQHDKIADKAVSELRQVGTHMQSVLSGMAKASFTAATLITQNLPNTLAAMAVSAALLGNVSEETLETLSRHCMEQTLSLCKNAALYERLDAKDKLLLTALLDTSMNEREKEAIHSIAAASVETNTDFLLMLSFANLESALGKLTNAETSSAQGIFQYTEDTWLGSFKRHASDFDPTYQELADKISFRNGAYKITGDGMREHILYLRHNAELHSFIMAKDMIDRDQRALRTQHNAPIVGSDAPDFMAIAQGLNMGRATKAARDIWDSVIDMMQRNDMTEMEKAEYAVFKQEQMVDIITDTYLEHFLGARGKSRFLDVYNNTKDPKRYRPVKDLYNDHKMPVSRAAVTANYNIFLGGDASVVETMAIIRNRVVQAMTYFDQRTEMYLIKEQDRQNGIATRTQPQSTPQPLGKPQIIGRG